MSSLCFISLCVRVFICKSARWRNAQPDRVGFSGRTMVVSCVGLTGSDQLYNSSSIFWLDFEFIGLGSVSRYLFLIREA